jgi:Xaa-Pro aminopeptidase
VHDTGERDDAFEVGMVITCEPGIYIPEEWIGIRLEDDLIITEDGCENLSRDIAL